MVDNIELLVVAGIVVPMVTTVVKLEVKHRITNRKENLDALFLGGRAVARDKGKAYEQTYLGTYNANICSGVSRKKAIQKAIASIK